MINTLAKYIHIPFDNGSNGGMDCFAFAKHFRKQEYGKDTPLAVPSFSECKNGLTEVFDKALAIGKYKRTDKPKDGDIVLLSSRASGKWHHVGIYLTNGVIHCTHGINNYSGVQYLPLRRINRIFKRHCFYTEKDG